MKAIWLTYAWADNADGDIDFYAQELMAAGLDVKLDRWNLRAGTRLWEQIASFVEDATKSDAWLLVATQTSLGSEACKEEFAYALDRALHTRGGDFPVIALFPSSVDRTLIPAGIRTRLHVSLTDPEWKERIVAAVEGRQAEIARPFVDPYVIKLHEQPNRRSPDRRYAIEMRPRAGTWSPVVAVIPLAEKERVNPFLIYGPANRWPDPTMILGGSVVSDDGQYWAMWVDTEATPTRSCFLLCDQVPSSLRFGVLNDLPQFQVKLRKV